MQFRFKSLKRDSDGFWVDPEGISWQDPATAMMHVVGFCACGTPEATLRYIRDGLMLFEIGRGQPYQPKFYEEVLVPARAALFGNANAEFFFAYWAAKEGYTEHGGGVGASWLTEKGRDLVEDIHLASEHFDRD